MYDGGWFSSAQNWASLVSGENNIDIFMLDAGNMDLNSIINKGYALDLYAAKGVSEFVDSLYPYIKDACVKDGKIYAVPTQLIYHTFSQNLLLMEDLKINPPKTFGDMCDTLANWYSDEERAAEYNFCEDYDVKNFMWHVLFSLYANHVYLSGEEMKLDTPVFRNMVEQLNNALKDVPPPVDYEMEQDPEGFFEKPTLFGTHPLELYPIAAKENNRHRIELYKSNPAFAENDSYKQSDSYAYPSDPMILKATADSPDGFAMDMLLVFVNSKTQDPENALGI